MNQNAKVKINARLLRFCERTGRNIEDQETLRLYQDFINFAGQYRKEHIDGNPPLWRYGEIEDNQKSWDTVLELVPIDHFVLK